jgi:hypothetical protein
MPGSLGLFALCCVVGLAWGGRPTSTSVIKWDFVVNSSWDFDTYSSQRRTHAIFHHQQSVWCRGFKSIGSRVPLPWLDVGKLKTSFPLHFFIRLIPRPIASPPLLSQTASSMCSTTAAASTGAAGRYITVCPSGNRIIAHTSYPSNADITNNCSHW